MGGEVGGRGIADAWWAGTNRSGYGDAGDDGHDKGDRNTDRAEAPQPPDGETQCAEPGHEQAHQGRAAHEGRPSWAWIRVRRTRARSWSAFVIVSLEYRARWNRAVRSAMVFGSAACTVTGCRAMS